MGLDMYLMRKHYVKNWNHTDPKEKHTITVKKAGKVVEAINPDKIKYVEEEIGYWRKANAIHKWFVDNVQDGEDDCGSYFVSNSQAEELLERCKKVIKASKLVKAKIHNGTRWTKEKGKEPIIEDGKTIKDPSVAMELLPATDGFFFGGTDYDEYYLKDIKDTVTILTEALKYPEAEIYYSSSW